MKRLILVLILLCCACLAFFAHIRGYYSMDDLLNYIRLEHLTQESKSPQITAPAQTVSVKNTILDESTRPKTQNSGLNKCTQATKKHVVYTQFACPEGYELSTSGWEAQANVTTLDAESFPNIEADKTSTSHYSCDGRTYCSQMRSCAEARFFLTNCPGAQMDGDDDGVPCEKQWCGRK